MRDSKSGARAPNQGVASTWHVDVSGEFLDLRDTRWMEHVCYLNTEPIDGWTCAHVDVRLMVMPIKEI